MLHILQTIGYHESNYQVAIWLFQSTFNKNSGHSSFSTALHNPSNFLNQIWTSMQLSQWVLSPQPHHIRVFFFDLLQNSHEVSQGTKKKKLQNCFCPSLSWQDRKAAIVFWDKHEPLLTHEGVFFFWWGCEKEAHCLAGMPKCIKGRMCRQPVRQMETSYCPNMLYGNYNQVQGQWHHIFGHMNHIFPGWSFENIQISCIYEALETHC